MRKINKKIIVPSLVISGAFAIAVGTAYALFTSNDENNIAISSGKVEMTAALDDVELYTALHESEIADTTDLIQEMTGLNLDTHAGKYYYVEQTGTFYNGGTATLNAANDLLELEEVAPGDKAVTTITITNTSSIDVKYRVIAECTSTADEDLRFFSKLVFGFGTEDLTSCSRFVSAWDTWAASASSTKDIEISIALPLDVINNYQEASTNVKFRVEAVQANAFTKNETEKYLLSFSDYNVTKDVDDTSKLNDLTLKAGEAIVPDTESATPGATKTDAVVQVEIPASTGGIKTNGEPIEEGDVLTLKVKQEDSDDATLALIQQDVENANVEDYDVQNFEVKVVDQDDNAVVATTDLMTVKLFVGANKAPYIVGVYHDGVAVTKVATKADLTEADHYFYDENDGYIYILANSFSPFTAVFSLVPQSANITKTPFGGNDCIYNFQCYKDADEVITLKERYYHADFIVSFDKDIDADGVTLLGHYDAYTAASGDHENFVERALPELDANTEIRLLKDGLNTSVTYIELALFGYADYDCLAAAVKGEKTYDHTQGMVDLMETAGFDADAKDFTDYPNGCYKANGFTAGGYATFTGAKMSTYQNLTMSVTLRLYKTADFDYTAEEVSPEEYIDIATVNYTFENPNF